MKKKGFATSAILYTILLLFLVLMVNILNNLQNKKVILDALKEDTIQALEQDTIIDAVLDQLGVLQKQMDALQTNNAQIQQQLDGMFHKIEVQKLYQSTTTFSYTGVNITIPANSYFCINAFSQWVNGRPISVAIGLSSTDSVQVKAENSITEYAATTTYCASISNETTYYIWAKNSEAQQSAIYLEGFYIHKD